MTSQDLPPSQRDSLPEDVKVKLTCPIFCDPRQWGSIGGEFNAEMRLKQTLLPFSIIQYAAEDWYWYLLPRSGYSTLCWHRSGSGC